MSVEIGDKIPDFELFDAFGQLFKSNLVIGKKIAVIYFYPKDDTRTCTIQACSFRDNYQNFKDLGAEVIGISGDNILSHLQFQNKYNLPFTLLSDTKNVVRRAFGVSKDFLGLIPGRATYVVDKEGVIVMKFDSTSGEIHIQKALEAIKNMV